MFLGGIERDQYHEMGERYTNADLKIHRYLRIHIKHLLLFEICARKIFERFI